MKRFESIYEFSDGEINKFILLLKKGISHTNTPAGKDLMKHHCLTKKIYFTVV